MSSLVLTFEIFIRFLCILQNILNVCQPNLSVLTNTVCHMITTVMVMMTVEMGAMRQAALVSVILQHRWESLVEKIKIPMQSGTVIFYVSKKWNMKWGRSLYSLLVANVTSLFHLEVFFLFCTHHSSSALICACWGHCWGCIFLSFLNLHTIYSTICIMTHTIFATKIASKFLFQFCILHFLLSALCFFVVIVAPRMNLWQWSRRKCSKIMLNFIIAGGVACTEIQWWRSAVV